MPVVGATGSPASGPPLAFGLLLLLLGGGAVLTARLWASPR